LNDAVSSKTAKAGDIVAFTVADDVRVDDMLVIAKGARGEAHVAASTTAKFMGKPGVVILEPDWVVAQDGRKLHVSGTKPAIGGDTATAQMNATIAGGVAGGIASQAAGTFIPLGFLAPLAVRGKDTEIGTNVVLSIYVASAGHIVSDLKVEFHDDFAH